jgi:hypothetical protein
MKIFSILIPLLFVGQASLARSGDDVVVSYDGGVVHRIRIACPAQMSQNVASCHSYEQARIDHIVWQYWINAAAPMYGVGLTPAEETRIRRNLDSQRAENERVVVHDRTLWTAVIRLQKGDPPSRVYGDAVASGVTKSELDREVAHNRSEAWLETGVKRATIEEVERASRDAMVLVIFGDHLRDLIKKRATEAHVSVGDAEEQLWTEVANRTHTHVVDPAFHLPEKRGVLNIHAETIQIH